MTLAKLLRAWRRRWQLTQEQAADALGISLGSIRNWEQERSLPGHTARHAIKTKLQSPPASGRS